MINDKTLELSDLKPVGALSLKNVSEPVEVFSL